MSFKKILLIIHLTQIQTRMGLDTFFLMEERLTLTAVKLESHRRDISLRYLQTFSTGRGPSFFQTHLL